MLIYKKRTKKSTKPTKSLDNTTPPIQWKTVMASTGSIPIAIQPFDGKS